MKILRQTDSKGFYIGDTVNNVAGAIDARLPEYESNQYLKWDGTKWLILDSKDIDLEVHNINEVTQTLTESVPVLDAEGNPVLDENLQPTFEENQYQVVVGLPVFSDAKKQAKEAAKLAEEQAEALKQQERDALVLKLKDNKDKVKTMKLEDLALTVEDIINYLGL